jgi:hypothetical protein
MHQDGETEAQLTVIHLHHWVADVDMALGIEHYHTLPREQLVMHVEGLCLCDVKHYDVSDIDSDPTDERRIQGLTDLVKRTLVRAAGAPGGETLANRGEALRERLRTVGAQREPVLILVGVKVNSSPA